MIFENLGKGGKAKGEWRKARRRCREERELGMGVPSKKFTATSHGERVEYRFILLVMTDDTPALYLAGWPIFPFIFYFYRLLGRHRFTCRPLPATASTSVPLSLPQMHLMPGKREVPIL